MAPPNGAGFEQLADGFRIGATTRSWMALFMIPFTCVWSGMSLGGIYGKQVSSGRFDPGSSLFGVPFLIGNAYEKTATIIRLFGGRNGSVGSRI
jgi:hypothetical protein